VQSTGPVVDTTPVVETPVLVLDEVVRALVVEMEAVVLTLPVVLVPTDAVVPVVLDPVVVCTPVVEAVVVTGGGTGHVMLKSEGDAMWYRCLAKLFGHTSVLVWNKPVETSMHTGTPVKTGISHMSEAAKGLVYSKITYPSSVIFDDTRCALSVHENAAGFEVSGQIEMFELRQLSAVGTSLA
jgi:hypothetical protein